MNIVIPMAGLGSRFASAGYSDPKPFIDVAGKPMIVRVMENLSHPNARFILLARAEHIVNNANAIARIEAEFDVVFVPIDKLTEGTACTVLYARNYLELDSPVIIANSDQIIDNCFEQYLEDIRVRDLDGSILTFVDPEKNPKWSFAKLNSNDLVSEVREKKPISEYATVGIYYFKKAGEMVDNIVQMVIENDRTNNEFYICPVYNYLIAEQKKIGIFNIEQSAMHGIGTPEDLNAYLRLI
ncbi:glycosyltransferase family 2 protein [Polynucleobacter brandtiae]|uniref:dTDP-glucose pyrophosphorylase n=1 Tax=Polynucleobacter brandtiae TaxID=1938816 RepID=A0A2M8VR56_9BURK|nr:glycosyltransferase family 2 protein [Polynucleobacter brandtiae]PJI79927.1 dTDP-glucose pyrophosphorylase [Polynucleobacter brandtiae]